MAASYKSPVCNKPLTKKEYEAALGIMQEKEAHLKHLEMDLKTEREQLRLQQRDLPKKIAQARVEATAKEKQRAETLVKGWKDKVETLRQRISQLEKGTTPQTEGLEFEDVLVKRLKKEFPEDEVVHKGKGGDILHTVMYEKKDVGIIVYECKRTPRISDSHIEQAYLAKQQREADYAVLITTGKRKGFGGLTIRDGVIIVSPLGVVSLASLLRTYLIEMKKAKVTKELRAKIAEGVLKYVASPQFKNPIEEVISLSTELQQMVMDEYRDHRRVWERRWKTYQRIRWDTAQIQGNVQLVLAGKPVRTISVQKTEPLLLTIQKKTSDIRGNQ